MPSTNRRSILKTLLAGAVAAPAVKGSNPTTASSMKNPNWRRLPELKGGTLDEWIIEDYVGIWIILTVDGRKHRMLLASR